MAPEKDPPAAVQSFPPQEAAARHFLGCELYWMPDRHGVPRVKRRTARQKLQAACRRMRNGSNSIGPCRGVHASGGCTPGDGATTTTTVCKATSARCTACSSGPCECVHMAQSARREAAEVHLGAMHPGPRPGKESTAPHHGGQTTERICLRASLCTADASTTEEPEAGTLHVRVCTGGAG